MNDVSPIARGRSPAPVRSFARVPELDVLRGFAALSVLLFHYLERYQVLFGHTTEPSVRWTHGYYGVQLFFMISGLVIPLAAERSRDALAFAWSRFARLYPAYWIAGAFTYALVLMVWLPGRVIPWWQAALNVTMLQELFDLRNVDGTFWTLYVELTFYAVVFALVALRRLDRLGLVLLVWVAAGMLAQQVLPAVAPGLSRVITPHLERVGITEWVHCFGLGYVVLRFSRLGRLGPVELGLLVLGLLRQYQVSLHWSVILLAAFALILYLAVTGRMRFLAAAPLLYLGALSYPLYLVHSNLGYVLIRGLEANRFSADLAIGVATVVAFVLAAMIHHLVEDPVRAVLLGRAPGGALGPVRSYAEALRGGLVEPLVLPDREKP